VGGIVFFVCAIIILWHRWYFALPGREFRSPSWTGTLVLYLAPPLCVGCYGVVLHCVAATNVIEDADVFFSYLAIDVVLSALVVNVLPVLGLDTLADFVERRNPGAVLPLMGALLGIFALNVGANIGEGDEVYTTLFPLGLTMLAWGAYVVLLVGATRYAEKSVVARDPRSALQLAVLIFAGSVPLARQSAGDWVSFEGTTRDILGAFPFLAGLLLIAFAFQGGVARRTSVTQVYATVIFCGLACCASLGIPADGTWSA
jgi:hypothetical protein